MFIGALYYKKRFGEEINNLFDINEIAPSKSNDLLGAIFILYQHLIKVIDIIMNC